MVTQLLWVILTGCLVFLFKLGLISRSFFLIFLPVGMLLLNLRQSGVQILLSILGRKGLICAQSPLSETGIGPHASPRSLDKRLGPAIALWQRAA